MFPIKIATGVANTLFTGVKTVVERSRNNNTNNQNYNQNQNQIMNNSLSIDKHTIYTIESNNNNIYALRNKIGSLGDQKELIQIIQSLQPIRLY